MSDNEWVSKWAASALTTADLSAFRDALSSLAPTTDDSERVERIRLLEELKGAVAAAQAVQTAAFVASQRSAQRAAGVPEARVGRGVAAQVALARRESPACSQRYCGQAMIVTSELPCTFSQLQAGRISEWRALIVARETAWLSREHRAEVDTELGPRLERLGDRRVEAEAKRLAYRLDPYGYVRRLAAAENERRVSLRPAPEVMSRLSALLPVAQGVAAHTALTRAADTALACGDPHRPGGPASLPRTRAQIMADTLVERLTGQAAAPDVPLDITLVMTDRALLGRHADTMLAGNDSTGVGSPAGAGPRDLREEPVTVLGYGPIPAPWARALIHRAGADTPMWIRRLFRHPHTGQLAAMDTHRRRFTANHRLFLRITGDDICATPWCNAPVRHIDHITDAARNGPTAVTNGQGLCEACNYAKQAHGWTTRRTGDTATDPVQITTPTGHTYSTGPPGPAGREPDPPRDARLRAYPHVA